MAQTVHQWLEIDGNEVAGESRISSMDREDTIECSSFSHRVGTTPPEAVPARSDTFTAR